VCQRACKLAIRAEIADQEAAEAKAEAAGEELPEQKLDGKLSKCHFDEAMTTARKSVSKTELARYLKFKKELSGGGSLKAASEASEAAASEAASGEGAAAAGESEDELYD
jgi:transitional endoplasmic reticulum ATPase